GTRAGRAGPARRPRMARAPPRASALRALVRAGSAAAGPTARSTARGFPRHLPALPAGLVQRDRNRLLPALDAPARAALQRSALASAHRPLDVLRCRFSVSGHRNLGALIANAVLSRMAIELYGDVNAIVGGLLRDLAFVQDSRQKMFGFKRAAAAVLSLEQPLTDLAGPNRTLARIPGVGPASAR